MGIGHTVLIWAASKNNLDVVYALLKIPGINVNAENIDGDTALIYAAENNHLDVVNALLKVPSINVNAQGNDGNIALIGAAREGHTKVVGALLGVVGIKVNARNNHGNTALIWAAREGYSDVVSALLNKGADANKLSSADKRTYAQLIWQGISSRLKNYVQGDSCRAESLLSGYQYLYQAMVLPYTPNFFGALTSVLDQLRREDAGKSDNQQRSSLQLLGSLIKRAEQKPLERTACVLIELDQVVMRLGGDLPMSLCINGESQNVGLIGKDLAVAVGGKGSLLEPAQLPINSHLSVRDARVVDAMRFSLVESALGEHGMTARDVMCADIFSIETDACLQHHFWVLQKANPFVTNEYEVQQVHQNGSNFPAKIDLPRGGMKDLSDVQKESPGENLLNLFGMDLKSQEFRFTLTALFFAFKAVCNKAELCPSKVVLSGVDVNNFQVQMRLNVGGPTMEFSQESRGEDPAQAPRRFGG